jgi:hypothetical protein
MGLPHRDLAELLADTLPGAPVYPGWPTEIVAPCIVVMPQGRKRTGSCHVEWTLRLSVGMALQQETEQIHDAVEVVLAAVPAGYFVGDTDYAQRSIGGVDYVFADTAITATR